MLIVIADDITGAAEIAGIAYSRGLDTRLQVWTQEPVPDLQSADVLVIATDTRSMTEAEAVAETRRIASWLKIQPSDNQQPSLPSRHLFKKTDSALRGHVLPELYALMKATACPHAVYLPANPSKDRIISQGIYYIKGVPIAETDFSFDPEFPATSSSLASRFPDAASLGIIMPDAESSQDIHRAIQEQDMIYAGAADLFSAYLDTFFPPEGDSGVLSAEKKPSSPRLILCGSTQSRTLDLGIPSCPMPLSLYDGGTDLTPWLSSALPLYHQGKGLILTIPYHHRTGHAAAVHLRTLMARMADALIASKCPSELIIEGGATAFATLQQLGWHQFQVVSQIAPGVVRMLASSRVFVTMKPGSYPWGPLFA